MNKAVQLLITAKDEASKVFGSIYTKIAGIAAAIAGLFGAKLFGDTVEEAAGLERQMGQLEAIIKATGGAAGLSAEDILKLAESLEHTTLASKDAVLDAAGALLTFKSVGGDAFGRTIALSQDLATVMGGDIKSAAVQLGKALEDPENGINALRRSGVSFTDAQRNLIRTLVDTGQAAKAQGIILDTVAQQVGGAGAGATGGLAGAWHRLSTIIGDAGEVIAGAVLPIFTRFANATTEWLKRLQDTGVIDRFGEAIAKAFEAGGKWVADFVGRIDFEELTAKLGSAATQIGDVFQKVGDRASTAANATKVAWNDMAGGFNATIAVIYGMGAAWFKFSEAVLNGVATLREKIANGLPGIFAPLKAHLLESVAEIRTAAGGMGAVADEMGRKAEEALAAAGEAANATREGFAALTEDAPPAAAAVGQVAEKTSLTADELDALGEGAQWAGGKMLELGATAQQAAAQQGQSADEIRAHIAELRKEYDALIKAGDTQGAAQALEDIRLEMQRLAGQATVTTEVVEKAFSRLGVTSQATLTRLAEDAKRDFDIIEQSGVATARDIELAFRAYADKAIAANGGVTDSSIKAKAAQLGLQISADEAGKVIITRMGEAAAATKKVDESATDAADGFSELEDAADKAGQAVQQAAQDAAGGFSIDHKQLAYELGLSRQEAEEFARIFGDILAEQSAKINDFTNAFAAAQRIASTEARTAVQQQDQERESRQASRQRAPAVPEPRSVASQAVVHRYEYEIKTPRGSETINIGSTRDADVLNRIFRELEESSMRT